VTKNLKIFTKFFETKQGPRKQNNHPFINQQPSTSSSSSSNPRRICAALLCSAPQARQSDS
jgi:hypothetical protein